MPYHKIARSHFSNGDEGRISMGLFCRLSACAGLIVLLIHEGYGKEWRGIIPLHSTRQDVIRILGLPNDSGLYNLSDAVVLISYSTGMCKEGGVWNVPRDTVLTISISPREALEISNLSLNFNRYQVVADKHLSGILYYNNAEEGVHITTDRQTVRSIDYLPPAKDEYLRCAKPPARLVTKDGRTIESHSRFDSYGRLPFNEEKQHLDFFGRRLRDFVGAMGYIVVYNTDGMSAREALLRANRAKEYLRRNHRVRDNSIDIVRGGKRKEFTLELYLVAPASQKPD
jgi:hypothetical protein